MFIKGERFKRTFLHDSYGGQAQSGISTPKDHNFIMLFHTPNGKEHGYYDKWDADDDFFHYSGEGQKGDMEFKNGNKAVRDHIANEKQLHLFFALQPQDVLEKRKGFVEYQGEFVCAGYHYDSDPESGRRVIIFELFPVEKEISTVEEPEQKNIREEVEHWSQGKLRERAMTVAVSSRTSRETKRDYYYRSETIKQYAHSRANGICEACEKPAPFLTINNTPYLEVHHIYRLADGGPDNPYCVIAICPNCHRKAHYSNEAEHFNKRLAKIARQKEGEIEKRKKVAG